MVQVAIMGYGTIGSGVAEILAQNAEQIKHGCGQDVALKYVLDLRDFPGSPVEDRIVHDFSVIEKDPEVSVVVETMGGLNPAYPFVKASLLAGKHVVTSNKALVAAYGTELLAIAREKNVNFFFEASVGGGILLAIAAVLIIWVILNKTTFGYELKAVGFNRDASRYAGINEKRNIIMSMVIAGAIAGMAGGLLYLAGTGKHIEIKDVLASEGFTGISVALLGLSHPIGVLFSGLFIAYLTAGGFYLQLFEFSTEIIDIIVAVIIYFSAFALIVKTILTRMNRKREKGGGRT